MNDQSAAPNASGVIPPDGGTQPMASELATRAADSHSAAHKIFIGPNGLRAGWRLLIYIALTFICIQIATTVLRAFHVHGPKTAADVTWVNMSWSRALQFACFLLPAFIMAKIERRPVGDYGLPASGIFGKQF